MNLEKKKIHGKQDFILRIKTQLNAACQYDLNDAMALSAMDWDILPLKHTGVSNADTIPLCFNLKQKQWGLRKYYQKLGSKWEGTESTA